MPNSSSLQIKGTCDPNHVNLALRAPAASGKPVVGTVHEVKFIDIRRNTAGHANALNAVNRNLLWNCKLNNSDRIVGISVSYYLLGDPQQEGIACILDESWWRDAQRALDQLDWPVQISFTPRHTSAIDPAGLVHLVPPDQTQWLQSHTLLDSVHMGNCLTYLAGHRSLMPPTPAYIEFSRAVPFCLVEIHGSTLGLKYGGSTGQVVKTQLDDLKLRQLYAEVTQGRGTDLPGAVFEWVDSWARDATLAFAFGPAMNNLLQSWDANKASSGRLKCHVRGVEIDLPGYAVPDGTCRAQLVDWVHPVKLI